MEPSRLAARAAFAIAAGQQHPSTVDAAGLERVAKAIDRLYAPGADAREQFLRDLESGLEHRVVAYVRPIEDALNRQPNGTQKTENRVQVSAADLIRAAPFQRAYAAISGLGKAAAAELATAFEQHDLPALEQAFQKLGLEEKPGWAARLFRSDALTSVAVRGDGKAALQEAARELGGVLEQIAAADRAEVKDSLREEAADRFAAMVNLSASLTRGQRYDAGVDLGRLFDALGSAGAPGFLPDSGLAATFQVLGQSVSTRFDFKNPVIQLVTVPLQLAPRGHDPSRYAPGAERPTIIVASDTEHLGRPGAPVGFVTKEGFAVVPEKVDAVLVNESKYGPRGHFGFGEMPIGAFSYEVRYWGASLKVPVEVEVGGRKLALQHGEYRVVAGDPKDVKIESSPGQVKITAGNASKTVFTKDGRVE